MSASSRKRVDDGLVYEVSLLVPIYWLLRWDVAPFLIAYLILFYYLFTADIYSRQYTSGDVKTNTNLGWIEIEDANLTSGSAHLSLVGIPIVLFSQLLVFLLSQWSMAIKCRLGYTRVSSVDQAKFVLVIASKNAGQDRMAPLLTISKEKRVLTERHVFIAGRKYVVKPTRFEFQKTVYEYDTDKNTFVRLAYPVTGKLQELLAHRGMLSSNDVQIAEMKWGGNVFDIPVPAFLDLYAEHLTAPFFVFQVLCLFLWSLDDYWYYSVITLLMLMLFEGMMCKRRQGGIRKLRAMRRQPVGMQIYRSGVWTYCLSDALVPGDIIALTTSEINLKQNGKKSQGASEKEYILPVDALILRGSCVVNEAMLTGESVPQIKESLKNVQDVNSILDLKDGHQGDAEWKRHLVFSGTALLQDSDGMQEEAGVGSTEPGEEGMAIPCPPYRGCTALVVRTGFGTTQGGLMRKILFATERVSAGSLETAKFIAVLLVFAIAASATVLHVGLQDESRNRFKLFLHCIMIVTSVVPPELPMELTLAVTNSLNALSKKLIYCTEPFRLPLAGKLDILCFDKTGTLTKDRMLLRGVVAQQDVPIVSSDMQHMGTASVIKNSFTPLSEGGEDKDVHLCVLSIMASCNSLFKNKGVVQGDPLEATTLQSSGFISSVENVGAIGGLGDLVHTSRGIRIVRHHSYPFSSMLKRMSVITSISNVNAAASPSSSGSGGVMWVLTKGAPEVLADMLEVVPSKYHQTYRSHMNSGKRVLALACKKVSLNVQNLRQYPRAEAERGLFFAGFLVYDCDLKADSQSVIQELQKSKHRVMMITGDSPYTAADIGRRLSILQKSKTLMLQTSESGKLVWRPDVLSVGSDDAPQTDMDFDPKVISTIAQNYDLCIEGDALKCISKGNAGDRFSALKLLCPHVNIFARVSPAQKEEVLLSLNEAGLYTLMCGDGTNDVGALKAAHVGVSIVNDPDFEVHVERSAKKKATANSQAQGSGLKKKVSVRGDRLSRAMAEIDEQEADPTVVKLGDASIASPFTARRTSIDSVLAVLRQGRCTLVTTIQVFKILALNCLVSAYMMSALYLRGLKNGDIQMTATGLVTAGLFFFLSLATPLDRISSTKPPSSVFSLSIALSVVGQFAVHMCCLIFTLHLCEEHVQNDITMTVDGKFYPNIVNSAIFLLTAVMQVNNFVVNYRGHPYTESISENKLLWRTVVAIYAVLLVVAGGQLDPLNDLLQMAPFPNPNFQATLLAVLIANFAASYGIEKLCQKLE